MAKEKKGDSFMVKMATFIVDKRNLFFLLIGFACIFSIFSMNWTSVENDVTKYLPEETETRLGIEAMNSNFTTFGMAQVMVSNITYETAEDLKDSLSEIEGIAMVTVGEGEEYYKDASALYSVNFDGGPNEESTLQAMEELREILADYDCYIDSTVGYDENAMLREEMTTILIVAVIIILVVLTLTSRSYAEIIVLLTTFGVAALLNMGTNFLCGTISFISDSIAVVLQLALAIDYAIILCHRFTDENETKPAREACITALSKAIPEISASSLTTISGLAALGFMEFKIGLDMAIVLMKSVFLSLMSVFILMPGLLVVFSKWIDKTRHGKLLPNVFFLGKFAVKVRRVLPPIFVLLLVGAFYYSNNCPYCYSYNDLETAKMSERQHAYFAIKEKFGTNNMMAVIVPSGNYEAERAILEELETREEVKSTMGLSNIEAMDGYMLTDALNPREFSELIGLDYEVAQALYSLYAVDGEQYGKLIGGLDEYKVPLFDMFMFLKDQMEEHNLELEGDDMAEMGDMLEQLEMAKQQMRSEKYSRMVVYLNLPEESEETFAFLQETRDIVGKYYEDDYYLVGNSTSSRDLSSSFVKDNLLITILSTLFVILVLLFTFQSVGLPVLLIIVIQGSIWINFSFPTLMEQPLYFLGYLIVQAIQMGANIDYAIVISSHYQEAKAEMPHKQAIVKAVNAAFPTVFTSGTMMAAAGLLIGNMSAQPVVSIMGMCIGRGTIISIILVLLVLPSILVLGDSIIERTSFKLKGIELKTREASGTVRVQGHVRGYISGVIDADVDGFLHGQLNATLSTEGQVTETEEMVFVSKEEVEQTQTDLIQTQANLEQTQASLEQTKAELVAAEAKVEAIKAETIKAEAIKAEAIKVETQEVEKGARSLWKRIWGGVLLLPLLLTLALGADTEVSALEEEVVLEIDSKEEFLQFAEDCRLDIYSKLLYVELKVDIDLTGTDFEPIPIFLGHFNGHGHTIKGLEVDCEGSYQGLFRYIEEGATVRNLNVEGTVKPSGSKDFVGGIAGQNAGIINNVSFVGIVSGGDIVGGLVGNNTLTGIVQNCDMEGEVQGDHFVGGLVGENHGVIRYCDTKAAVNITPQQNSVEISDITLDNITGAEAANTVTDIGGVTGYNHGVVRECTNRGDIGYKHMGYNIGGIVGSQMGYVVDCMNYGKVEGRKEIGGIVGQMEPASKVIYSEDTVQILQDQLGEMSELAETASNHTTKNTKKINKSLDKLQENVDKALSALEILSDGEEYPEVTNPNFGNVDPDNPSTWNPNTMNPNLQWDEEEDEDTVAAAKTSLNEALAGIRENLDELSKNTEKASNTLTADIEALTDQGSEISQTVETAEENLGVEVTDISDTDTEADFTGKVQDCINYGTVLADVNGGGIAGAMGLETDLDAEEDVEVEGEESLNAEGELRAVVLRCDNKGEVTVGKQYAGGIVGWIQIGLVKDCYNSGKIDAQDADYVGGIAGSSEGFIRHCNVKCELAGDTYVGGIAGCAKIVTDCHSMVSIFAYTEKTGALIGSVEEWDEIARNFYMVSGKDIGAVDGISYDAAARPLKLEAFLALESLPEDFEKIKVEFLFEDGTQKTVLLTPGEPLLEKDIPSIPDKEGYVASWDGLNSLHIDFDQVFTVVYSAIDTIIQSEEMGENGRPLFLIEGTLTKDAKVHTSKSKVDCFPQERQTLVEHLHLEVEGSEGPITVRLQIPIDQDKENLKLFVAKESEWQQVDAVIDGSYMVFDLDRSKADLALISITPLPILECVVIAVVILLVVVVLIGRIRKKRKSKGSNSASESNPA
ncbi:MAG: MMPL family transporter [Lachnospiraceae bacterium]|nr:MMPL family transporter [Lachnospiraceae bacterium]